MFGKIRYIDDITAVVDINKSNMVVPNLMNLHVVFENDKDKLLGEVKKVDTETVHIDLLGQFVENRFIAGTIKKPTLDSRVRVINDDELNIILGKDDEKSLYLGHSAIYPEKMSTLTLISSFQTMLLYLVILVLVKVVQLQELSKISS